MMDAQQDLTQQHVGHIVSDNYQAANVFKRYGIDFCCGGGISLAEACRRKELDPNEVVSQLQQIPAAGSGDTGENYAAWSPQLLISYITETHHRYVRGSVDEIAFFAAKVARRHGENYPENVAISEAFSRLVPELLDHLETEESTIFPLIQKAAIEKAAHGRPLANTAMALRAELDEMVEEHEAAGNTMKKIAALSNDYTPPEGACTTYRVLYKNLQQFEADLHKHVNLENNILMPKAEALLEN